MKKGIYLGLVSLLVFAASAFATYEVSTAQAALTLNNFVGFETGGTDELLSSAGTPFIESTTPSPHSGDYSAEAFGGTDQYDIAIITGGSTDSDNDFIVGFWINFQDKTPSSASDILEAWDDGGTNKLWFLQIATNGDISAADNSAGTIGSTETDPFTINQWHLVEIRWQHLASGAFDLWIDGVSTNINGTGLDFSGGGTIGADSAFYRFASATGATFNIDDFYAYSGATGTGDFLGNAEVFRYQANTDSAVPDGSCATFTNNLTAGVWQDLGETPRSADATEPKYSPSAGGSVITDDTQSGNNYRPGPSGDSNIDGDSNIKGGKWTHYLRRGNGASSAHYKCIGDDSVSTFVSVSLDTSYGSAFHEIRTDTAVPSSSQYCRYGMATSGGGRDIFAEEMWCFVLHVPDAGGTPRRIFRIGSIGESIASWWSGFRE